jgi:AraC family transcriptional regulator
MTFRGQISAPPAAIASTCALERRPLRECSNRHLYRNQGRGNRALGAKLEQQLLDLARYRSYGVHYTDPRTTPACEHHVEFCLSIEREEVGPNGLGIVAKSIPANRCALARDIGSRHDNKAAKYLKEVWLPRSGETAGSFPIFFHYVNVGPCVRNEDMITDVYLPLK